jgi:hypothetical protein
VSVGRALLSGVTSVATQGQVFEQLGEVLMVRAPSKLF